MVLITFVFRSLHNVLGFAYPAYLTFKTLKAQDTNGYGPWLMYWVVFGLFSSIEMYADFIAGWLPFYNVLKLAMVLWMTLPQFRGATYVYETLVYPQLVKHEETIDAKLLEARAAGQERLQTIARKGLVLAHTAGRDAVTKFNTIVVSQVTPRLVELTESEAAAEASSQASADQQLHQSEDAPSVRSSARSSRTTSPFEFVTREETQDTSDTSHSLDAMSQLREEQGVQQVRRRVIPRRPVSLRENASPVRRTKQRPHSTTSAPSKTW